MKKLLNTLILLLSLTAFKHSAQTTCTTAISTPTDGTWRGKDSFNVAHRWHKFNAGSEAFKIKLNIKSYTPTKYTVNVYNTCTSTARSSTVTNSGDSVTVIINGLTSGNDYYIDLKNNTAGYEVYNIALVATQNPSVTLTLNSCTASACANSVCGELVCNGSFECAVPGETLGGTSEINKCNNWTTANWGSPDFFSANTTAPTASVSCNFMGSQAANQVFNNGNSYAGIIVHTTGGYNEYLQTRLTSPMQAGKSYLISFYVSRGENSAYQVKSLAIFTSSTQVYNGNYGSLASPAASVSNTSLLNDFSNWQRVTFCYTPSSGNEEYLIIGSPTNTQVATASTATTGCSVIHYDPIFTYSVSSYIYIDDVSVVPMNSFVNTSPITICPSTTMALDVSAPPCVPLDSYSVAWTPTTGLYATNGFTTNISIPNTTNYSVNVTVVTSNSTSCVSTTSLVVNTFPLGLTVTPSSYSFCSGNTVTLTATPGYTGYLWYPGGAITQSIVISPTASVIYSVIGTSSNSCLETGTVSLTTPIPGFTFAPTASPAIICTNQGQSSSTLTANSNYILTTYTWNPGAIPYSSVVVTPNVTSTYTLSASIAGCTYTLPVTVAVSSVCCTSTITAFPYPIFPNQGTVTYTTPFVFNADVTVPSGTEVWLAKAEFLFAPGVRIIVQPNAKLHIEGSHFYACSTSMWKGIVVQDGGAVRSFSTLTNTDVVMHSLIEDAEIAIDASGQATSIRSAVGDNWIVDLKNTTFNKNYIAVKFDGYQQNGADYPFVARECVFTSRTLTYSPTMWPRTTTAELRAANNVTTGLIAPYELQSAAVSSLIAPYTSSVAYCGIYINNIGVSTGTNYYGVVTGSVSNVGDFNLFDHLTYGIAAVNSNVKSVNNVFQNTHATYACNPRCTTQPGVAISHYVNNNQNMRLNLNSGSSNMSLGNRFWDCHRAVDMSQTYKFDCNYATFRSTQATSVTPGIIRQGNAGIFARTNRFDYDISNNAFNNINTCIQIGVSGGLFVNGGSTVTGVYAKDLFIQGNYFGPQVTSGTGLSGQYLNYAVLITAPNTFTWTNVGNTGLYINSNSIDRAYRGIYVSGINNYPAAAVNNNILLTNDGLYNSTQRGIDFSINSQTTSIAGNTLQAANTTNTLVTLIYGGANTNAQVTCNFLSNAYQGFEFNSNNPGTTWKGNQMQPMARGMVLRNNGIIGTQGNSVSPIDNRWNGTWTLNVNYGTWTGDISTLANNSPLWTTTVSGYLPPNNDGVPSVQSYSLSGLNIATGSYSCGGGGIINNFVVPSTTSLTAEKIFIANNTLYRNLYFNPSVVSGDATMGSFFSGLSGSSLESFMSVEESIYNNDPSTAATVLSGITTTNSVEDNYVTFYGLYIDYLNDVFDSSDSTALLSMAGLCPGIDGSCVYQARTLYDLIFQMAGVYSEDCYNGGAGRLINPNNNNHSNTSQVTIPQTDKQWRINLYPNPAKTEIIVSSDNANEQMTVRVTDVNGRLLQEEKIGLINNTGKVKLDLQNGIYFVTLINSNNERVIKKLIISK